MLSINLTVEGQEQVVTFRENSMNQRVGHKEGAGRRHIIAIVEWFRGNIMTHLDCDTLWWNKVEGLDEICTKIWGAINYEQEATREVLLMAAIIICGYFLKTYIEMKGLPEKWLWSIQCLPEVLSFNANRPFIDRN
jgi:hypothetical protein